MLVRTLLPATASVLVHAGVVTAIVLGPGWLPDRTPVLVAELVEDEAPPAAPPAPVPPKPVVRERRPITPPRPLAAPLPSEPPAPARPEPEPEIPKAVVPEPPAPLAPEPPRLAPQPPLAAPREPEPPKALASAPAPPAMPQAPPAAPGPVAGSVSSVPQAGPGELPPRAPGAGAAVGAPPPSRGPDVAALPPSGVTREAIPRGGYQYRPSYPSRARSLGVEGTTLLHVLVSDRGRVTEVVVKQSAGHPDLDQAAVDAVRRWRFEPARRGDDAVAMWVQLPFEFRLR